MRSFINVWTWFRKVKKRHVFIQMLTYALNVSA